MTDTTKDLATNNMDRSKLDQNTLQAVADFIRKHRVDVSGAVIRRKNGEVIPTYDYKLIEAIEGSNLYDR